MTVAPVSLFIDNTQLRHWRQAWWSCGNVCRWNTVQEKTTSALEPHCGTSKPREAETNPSNQQWGTRLNLGRRQNAWIVLPVSRPAPSRRQKHPSGRRHLGLIHTAGWSARLLNGCPLSARRRSSNSSCSSSINNLYGILERTQRLEILILRMAWHF